MHTGIVFLLTAVLTYVTAQNIPGGFIPLPPLPLNSNIGANTNKPKATPKPTQAPITKKPVLTKGTPKPTQAPITKKPITTKAPFKPTTVLPTLAPSTHRPALTQNPKCGLNINVPKANCPGGNSAVQKSLDTLKKELDRTRQQQQVQNTAVQSLVSKLQTQQSTYLNKIADLQNEVKNLVAVFNSKPVPTGTPATVTASPQLPGASSALLQQAVQNVRQDMNSAVRDFNNKVFNLSSLMITDQQQEMKVHQTIEAEIRQQGSDISRLSQQITDLNRLLQQLNTSSPNSGAGATNNDVLKLQNKINKVENDIQQYKQSQQSKINGLTLKTATLQSEVRNHTNQLNGLQTRLLIEQSKVSKVDKDITVVHDALAQFRKATMPKMNQINSDVQTLTTNMTAIDASVKRVGSTAFKLVMQVGQDSAKLTSLDLQSSQLKTDIGKIQSDLTSQKSEITSLQSGLSSLKRAIPLADLTKMNNSVLDVLNALTNGKQPTKKQLNDLTQAITAIKNKIGNLAITGSPIG